MNLKHLNPVTPDYSSYNIDLEIKNLKDFLARNNMRIPENFFQAIRQGDVIDLYTCPPDMKQLYCNSEFRRLCSYTDEQMKNHPFTKLFWRSDDVQVELIKRATHVALHENEAQPWGIGNHELIESLHPRKRTFEIDLGWGSPCFDITTGARVAFVSSLCVRFIFEWPEFQQG